MLFLLGEPLALLALAVSLVVAVLAHAIVQAYVATRLGDAAPAAHGRVTVDPRRHVDAFGVIVMLISGIGWAKPVPLTEPRFRVGRGRYVLAVVSGALANVVVAVLAAVALAVLGVDFVAVGSPIDPLGADFGLGLLQRLALVNALVAVLSLVPLPPLDGARLLWLFAPRTAGWQKARYYLEEQNIGLGIVVVLMLPVFGAGLLRVIVSAVGAPILALIYRLVGISTLI